MADLSRGYETYCDPRLNYAQASSSPAHFPAFTRARLAASEAMKRAALIGIISLAGLLSLWLLLAWLGKTENYRQPRPGMRFENKGDKASAPRQSSCISRILPMAVGHYQVRMEKGFLKCRRQGNIAAQQIDHNGTKAWQFTLNGGALGGLVQYDAARLTRSSPTRSNITPCKRIWPRAMWRCSLIRNNDVAVVSSTATRMA